jgi:cobyrinic acid a,c-diamide synthase
MAALRRRGFTVQGFKVGPDFIDTGFHAAATNRPSHNLDGWMLDRDTNRSIFLRNAASADVAIIEGVMGLFDGASSQDESGSTAEMAKWLGLPVVLVIDASAQARSAAAIVHGFETFDPDLRLIAVIANKVAGEAHYRYIEGAIHASCRAKPIGWLVQNDAVRTLSRHLGLVTAPEAIDATRLNVLADWLESGIDLDQLLALATIQLDSVEIDQKHWHVAAKAPARIGLARDRAFCFYYQDNLELLQYFGAELVEWSPMSDALPTGLHGLYFGGGYPELHSAALAENASARKAVRDFIIAGGAVYAECGGLMYLTKAIVDADGSSYPMVGVLPTSARMHNRLVAIGYVEVEGTGAHQLLPEGETVRGHQFRYSDIDPVDETIRRCYRLLNRYGEPQLEGYIVKNCLASYVHLHFLSNPGFAARWLDLCCQSNVTT